MTASEPPVPIWELYPRVEQAIHRLDTPAGIEMLDKMHRGIPYWLKAHFEMEHSVPSPSTVMRCRYQMWCYAKGLDPDAGIPTNWKVRQAAGVMAEPYWLAVLRLADFHAYMPDRAYKCGPHMMAHPDAVLNTGDLVEFKSKTGYGYKSLIETRGGVAMAEFGEYMQMQLYMYATGADFALYLASPADPSLLQNVMRKRGKYGPTYELPPFHMEWVARDNEAIDRGLARAELMAGDSQSDVPPEREFSGMAMDLKGNKTWPCGYCPFQRRCVDAWGFGYGQAQ